MQVKDLVWREEKRCGGEDVIFFANSELCTFSVLDRLTGYEFEIRDTETGLRDPHGKFWLASGNYDIRQFPELSIDEAIRQIKKDANVCNGV
jgi:hypothetical protein